MQETKTVLCLRVWSVILTHVLVLHLNNGLVVIVKSKLTKNHKKERQREREKERERGGYTVWESHESLLIKHCQKKQMLQSREMCELSVESVFFSLEQADFTDATLELKGRKRVV